MYAFLSSSLYYPIIFSLSQRSFALFHLPHTRLPFFFSPSQYQTYTHTYIFLSFSLLLNIRHTHTHTHFPYLLSPSQFHKTSHLTNPLPPIISLHFTALVSNLYFLSQLLYNRYSGVLLVRLLGVWKELKDNPGKDLIFPFFLFFHYLLINNSGRNCRKKNDYFCGWSVLNNAASTQKYFSVFNS